MEDPVVERLEEETVEELRVDIVEELKVDEVRADSVDEVRADSVEDPVEEEERVLSVEELLGKIESGLDDECVHSRVLEIIGEVAVSGRSQIEWPEMVRIVSWRFQRLVKERIGSGECVLVDGEDASYFVQKVLQRLAGFEKTPWTLQRMCELLMHPEKGCKTPEVFFVAFGKLVTGIRERPSQGDTFGLSSAEAATDNVAGNSKPAYQLPFFWAPSLRSETPL